MKELIKDQSIMIDDHTRGVAHGHFDDDDVDIHLDKKAKSGKYRIRVPLNTKRPVTIERRGIREQRIEGVPEDIAREVREAFEDDDKRRTFVNDLVKELRNFPYQDERRENDRKRDINKAFGALRRISKHFGLPWSNKTVRGFLKEYKTYGMRFMVTITDGPSMYYMSVDNHHFMIADFMAIGLHDRSTWEEISFEDMEKEQ